MGEGARCGIANHYDLRAFPRSTEEIDERGPVTAEDVPAISEALLEHAVTHGGHAGGPRSEQRATGDD